MSKELEALEKFGNVKLYRNDCNGRHTILTKDTVEYGIIKQAITKLNKVTNVVNRGYNQHPSITLDAVIGILYKEESK